MDIRSLVISGNLKAAALACAVLVVGSCGQAQQPAGRRPSLLDAVEARSAHPSLASWRYRPSEAAAMYVAHPLGPGKQLRAGGRGERWLVDERAQLATVSPWLLPEDIRGVESAADGRWLFIGGSGTVYEASEPLGRIERSHAPPERLVRVAGAAGTIVGIRSSGELLATRDAGRTWIGVGPTGTRFADVGVDGRGGVLALAVPEALWVCPAGGDTCRAVDAAPFGALEIRRDLAQGLLVRGLFETRRWQAGPHPLGPAATGSEAEGLQLGVATVRGESAAALAAGQAVVSRGRTMELLRVPKKGWQLLTGTFGGRLAQRNAVGFDRCKAIRLGAFDRWMTVACLAGVPSSRGTEPVTFFRSDDAGRTWSREPFHGRASARLRLAVGRDGALLVTGICAPHENEEGCEPRGIYHRGQPAFEGPSRRSPPRWILVPSAAPGLSGIAHGILFSTDGRRAYAAGQSSKDGHFAVFASTDLKSFEARETEVTVDEEHRDDRKGQDSNKLGEVEAMASAPDGTLSVVVRQGDKVTLIVTDEEGRAVSVSSPPEGTSLIGAAGSYAIALSPDTRWLFESLDGGSTWARAEPMPRAPCPGDEDCRVPLFCAPEGCAIGNDMTRVGWGTEPSARLDILPPPENERAAVEYRLRTPLSCTLDPDRPWTPITGASTLPTAAQAALGTAVWFILVEDTERASAKLVTVNRQHDSLVNSVLLEPVHDPEDYALAVVRQVEGGAALRYRTPEARNSAQILDVEVAWNNLLEGTLRRARIPSAGAYQPGDYIKSNGRTQTAQPNLLSIATGGVYVRLHQAASTDQVAYYLDGRRVTTVPRMSWPAALGHRAHSEMARVGGQDAHLLVAGDGAVVALARLSSGNWKPAACTIGLEQPGLFGLTQLVDITYLGGQPAIHYMLSAAAGAVQAFAFPLLASGPAVGAPVALPSQDRATDPPQACTDDMVRTSPRIVVPPVATTRHAVVVDDVDEPPHVMLTSRAVMHGTADAACVDALEASSVNLPDSQPVEEQAVIDLRDLKRSWLFRKIEREKVEVVEARSMACSFDPKAEVPEELGEALRRMGRRRR